MSILIRWLRQKPADLALQCFRKKDKNLGSAGQGLIITDISSYIIIFLLLSRKCHTKTIMFRFSETKMHQNNSYYTLNIKYKGIG